MSRGSELKIVRNYDNQLTTVTLFVESNNKCGSIFVCLLFVLIVVYFHSILFFKKIYHGELSDKDN